MKINLKNNLIVLFPLFFFTMGFTIYLYFQNYFVTYDNENFIAVIPFIIILIPNFILHIQYLIEDKGKVIEINNGNIIYSKGELKKIIPFSEISKVEKFVRTKEDGSPLFKMPWHFFYFYKISLKDETYIFLTCLMERNLYIPSIEIIKSDRLIPLIGSHKEIVIISNNQNEMK